MEQGLLGLSTSKGVHRPSTRFALQTQAYPAKEILLSRQYYPFAWERNHLLKCKM
jgi:hypothetical protein